MPYEATTVSACVGAASISTGNFDPMHPPNQGGPRVSPNARADQADRQADLPDDRGRAVAAPGSVSHIDARRQPGQKDKVPDFIPASDVHAPATKWTLDRVVYDEGERMFAVAVGTYKLEDGTKQRRLAGRWNGHAGSPLGVPNSFNHPTWFILPDPFAVAIADAALRLIARDGLDDDASDRIKRLVKFTDEIGSVVD